MGPLWPAFCLPSGLRPHLRFAPTARFSFGLFFFDVDSGWRQMPRSTPVELATAIIECIDKGARIINLSLGFAQPSTKRLQVLDEALDYALARGVIVVAAAGNQGTLGSSTITSHPWVMPVVACDLGGRPTNESNLGGSIGRRGVTAPGVGITSLGLQGQSVQFGGTSVAVPFVTGTMALLWSAFPAATATEIKLSISANRVRRGSVVPPLLDAMAAYAALSTATSSYD